MFSNCSSSAAKQIQIHNDEKWNEGAPGKFPAARKCIQPVSITDHTPQLGHLLRTCLDIRNVLFFLTDESACAVIHGTQTSKDT